MKRLAVIAVVFWLIAFGGQSVGAEQITPPYVHILLGHSMAGILLVVQLGPPAPIWEKMLNLRH